MMRVTTIPFSFTLAAAAGGYQIAGPFPLPYRITGLYALAEPSPAQLLTIRLYPWGANTPPAAGVPSGATIFDEFNLNTQIRLGRIPVDMDLDITISNLPYLLCYALNGAAVAEQCQVQVKMALSE